MKHTKLAIALLVAFSGAVQASGVNFSQISAGTVTNLTISQTGTGKSRISSGNALTSTQGDVVSNTSARGVSFSEAAEGTGDFVHRGALTTLSLTQVTSSANGESDNNENTITGQVNTNAGSVTVAQTGDANALDLVVGASDGYMTSSTVAITQTGNDNQVELTRTGGGTHTDTITLLGNSNAVKVTGTSAASTSSTLSIVTGAGSDLNQITASQAGSGANLGVTLAADSDSNILDLTQNAASTALTLTLNGDTNHVFTSQTGASSQATLNITGSLNKVDVSQSGAGANSILTLSGSSNDIGITQSGASAYANLNISSTSATVAVTQSTASASYTYAGAVPTGGSITVTQ